MERLDKYISSQTEFSRREVKELISKGQVMVNDEFAKRTDLKIDEINDIIKVQNEVINFKKFVYLLLNKPKGYISATEDLSQKTVLDLVPEKYKFRNLFPAGRLDKDTTGLMLITDDGKLAHDILSPSKHIEKTYVVTIDIPVTEEMKNKFNTGIKLNDGECKQAELEILDKYIAKVTLTEGRYHQIKRMFGCFGAKVIELKRVKFGKLELPIGLKEGTIREATEDEMNLIKMR